jgi:peptidoglycan/xylan/chitin deacetylase (PgdA/CDA1 family)
LNQLLPLFRQWNGAHPDLQLLLSRHHKMRLVSPLLKRAVYPALHHSGWLNRMSPLGGYAVVNYHGLVPSDHSKPDRFLDRNLVRTDVFREQLRFLKSHYQIIHPEDFRAAMEQGKPLPPRTVLVTCDDGLSSALTGMLPVLQSEGVPCLFFVTGDSCGENPGMLWYEELCRLMRIRTLSGRELPPGESDAHYPSPHNFQARWWSIVKAASRLDAKTRMDWMALVRGRCGPAQGFYSEKRRRLLSLTELRQLAESGMSVGAHTLTHPVLCLCRDEESRHEIQQSKLELERALGRPVWAFAYPFGNPATIGEREVRFAAEAGFTCAFLNVEHWSAGPSNAFTLPRIHVGLDATLPEFAAHLSGVHRRLQRVVGG